MSKYDRIFVKDIVFDFDDCITLYEFIKLLDEKEREITRDLGVGINRAITVSLEKGGQSDPKLILSIYKSDGGF